MVVGLASRTVVGVVVQHLGEISLSEQHVGVQEWVIFIPEVLEGVSPVLQPRN
jgi:hypothetical protein